MYRARTPTTTGKFFFWHLLTFHHWWKQRQAADLFKYWLTLRSPIRRCYPVQRYFGHTWKCHAKFSAQVSDSHDLISNFPYCLTCSSCDVSLENFVWDQLKIPSNIFFYSHHLSACIDIVRKNSVLGKPYQEVWKRYSVWLRALVLGRVELSFFVAYTAVYDSYLWWSNYPLTTCF